MAGFIASYLSPACGFDGEGPRIWTFKTDDPLATVQGANYFNNASRTLNIGDFIVVQTDIDAAFGSSVVDILAVRDIDGAGVVTVTPAASEITLGS